MEKDFDVIDGYLHNKLSSEEQKAFEERLSADAEFNQLYNQVRVIRASVRNQKREEILDFLDQTENQLNNQVEKPKERIIMKKFSSIAASLIVVVAIGFFALFLIQQQGKKAATPDLFAENYRPYQNVVNGAERGSAREATLFNKAYDAYDATNYELAASTFKSLLVTDKTAANFFYSGISNLEQGNMKEAQNNLNAAVNNFGDEFDAQGKWYMALALIKEKNTKEAAASLVALILDNSSYKEKAESMLETLGYTMRNGRHGEVIKVDLFPEEDDVPSGIVELRQMQFGNVVSEDGSRFKFWTEYPIKGLEEGDIVSFVALTHRNNRGMDFAFLIGKE